MSLTRTGAASLAIAATLLAIPRAEAVPSFARQTGFSCAQCHTQFPELTPLGRAFKASGYVISTMKSVSDHRDDRAILDLLAEAPLSAMVQASVTRLGEPLPGASGGTSQRTDVMLPQQLSLFYAGKIAPEVGGFIQLTYDGAADALSMDNTDLRFAHPLSLGSSDLILGLSVNNNPTVTDLWHGTPAWGWPFAAPGNAPGPIAGPMIGGLGQSVAGLNGYAYWNGMVYLEAGAYRSSPLGVTRPLGSASDATSVISGVAPYWRAAFDKEVGAHSFEIGTFGMAASFSPGGDAPLGDPTNRYVDYGVDAQYQYLGDAHIITANASFTHEDQTLDASSAAGASNASDSLNSTMVSAGYIYRRLIGVRAGFFDTTGTSDAALYAPGAVSGSTSGSPNTRGFIGEVNYTPWLNTKLSVQYTSYLAFNGTDTNYDGAGRDASANDTLYLVGWIAF